MALHYIVAVGVVAADIAAAGLGTIERIVANANFVVVVGEIPIEAQNCPVSIAYYRTEILALHKDLVG